MGFASWVNDLRWAANMRRARRYRRVFSFSERAAFDNALRPRVKGEAGVVIDYPDALYHITVDDVIRAHSAVILARMNRKSQSKLVNAEE